MRVVQEAFTFDDVLLLPAYSAVLPKDVDLADPADPGYRSEHPAAVLRHGYGYRITPGYRSGPRRVA